MSATSVDDAIDCRNTIREKAFGLAESGIFADWEAGRLALSSTSHAGDLQHVFASPFFRLDLNQRCRAAERAARVSTPAPVARVSQILP